MRFLGYTLADESDAADRASPPELYERMGTFVEEATKAGVIVATGGIAPTSEGAKITLKDGEFTVVDGPFVEAKEIVGGWALMECRDLGRGGRVVEAVPRRARRRRGPGPPRVWADRATARLGGG